MHRALAIAIFLLAAFTARAAQHGTWHLSQRDDGRVQIDLISDHNQNSHPNIRALGYQPDAEELVRFRIHGVSPEFIKGMKERGGRDLESDNLVNLRIHGASVDYVRELRDLGYPNLSAEQLVQMRIHGVSASYIRDLR